MEESNRYFKVCVTGGSGYIGSSLIKKLLNKGVYYVHATLRDLGQTSKVEVLKQLPGAETRLQLFEADIYNPQQFEAAIKDCQFVFHLATPFIHYQNSQYKDITEATIAAAKSIIESCRRSPTVRRLIYTASVTAASPLMDDGTGFKECLDDNCWTPIHHPVVWNSPHKDYITSKTEAEKAILSFGEASNLEVVTLACGLVGGETVLSYTPSSVPVLVSQLAENEFHYQSLRLIEELCGKIPILHIEDTCDAHIFCIENTASFQGRFLCASDFVSSTDIAEYFQLEYPEFEVKQVYLNGPRRTVKWASTKLIVHGFKYKYDMKMILDDSVKCARRLRGL